MQDITDKTSVSFTVKRMMYVTYVFSAYARVYCTLYQQLVPWRVFFKKSRWTVLRAGLPAVTGQTTFFYLDIIDYIKEDATTTTKDCCITMKVTYALNNKWNKISFHNAVTKCEMCRGFIDLMTVHLSVSKCSKPEALDFVFCLFILPSLGNVALWLRHPNHSLNVCH